jgi:hypothetical protein
MHSDAGDTTQLVPGSPIRTPWDHSSVDSSPRPIAASHVLHRLLVPRHPPFALTNLTTKMLASTMQFSTNNHPHPTPQHPPPNQSHDQPKDSLLRPMRANNPRKPTPHTGFVPSGPNRMPEHTTTSSHHTLSTPTPPGSGSTRHHGNHQPAAQPASPPTSNPHKNIRPARGTLDHPQVAGNAP